MNLPLQVTFRNVSPFDSLTEHVRKKAEKLDTFFGRINGCRVAIEAPHTHHHHGFHYRVRVDLTVPGAELVAGHGDRPCYQDPFAAVDGAFKHAERLLKSHAERHRGGWCSA